MCYGKGWRVRGASPTDAMVEGGVGQGTCFCKCSPASMLDSRQDMVPPSPVFGLTQLSGNGVSETIATEMRPNQADLYRWSKMVGTIMSWFVSWYLF